MTCSWPMHNVNILPHWLLHACKNVTYWNRNCGVYIVGLCGRPGMLTRSVARQTNRPERNNAWNKSAGDRRGGRLSSQVRDSERFACPTWEATVNAAPTLRIHTVLRGESRWAMTYDLVVGPAACNQNCGEYHWREGNDPITGILLLKHIEAETQWPPFRRRHFWWDFTEVCSQGSN